MQPERTCKAACAGGMTALAGMAYAGLRAKPAALPDQGGPSEDFGTVALPHGLPLPVRRYIQRIAGSALPVTRTVVVWGRGTLYRPLTLGVQMRVPIVWKSVLRPCQLFHQDVWLTWFGRHVVHYSDDYLAGHGQVVYGPYHADGWSIGQAEQALMWLATIVFAPSALLTEAAVQWDMVSATQVHVSRPELDLEQGITLQFDPVTALLTTLSMQRFSPATARPELYQVSVADYCRFGRIALPTTISGAWAPSPEFDVTLDGLKTNISLPAVAPGDRADRPAERRAATPLRKAA